MSEEQLAAHFITDESKGVARVGYLLEFASPFVSNQATGSRP